MQVQIRPAQIEDAEEVSVLSVQLGYSLSKTETEGQIQEILRLPNDCVFAACIENKIIGWIHAFVALRIESKPFVEIGGLVVDEAFRGKGAGKALIAQVKAWCVQKNITNLRLRTNVKRTETHRFYRHLGFMQTKEQKVFEMDLSK